MNHYRASRELLRVKSLRAKRVIHREIGHQDPQHQLYCRAQRELKMFASLSRHTAPQEPKPTSTNPFVQEDQQVLGAQSQSPKSAPSCASIAN